MSSYKDNAKLNKTRQPVFESAGTLECFPDNYHDLLDEYQDIVFKQITYDRPLPGKGETAKRILGRTVHRHMLSGISEELEEITGPDKNDPEYSRLGTILRIGNFDVQQPEDAGLFSVGVVGPNSVTRHIKEFGDTTWYGTNFLSLFGLRMSQAASSGIAAFELDRISAPRASVEDAISFESNLPGIIYSGKKMRFIKAATNMMHIDQNNIANHDIPKKRDGRIENERELLIAYGSLLVSMNHVLVCRLGSSLQEFLQQNIDKINKRIADGTVFDKSGGDDR